jgi:hypothetical protein
MRVGSTFAGDYYFSVDKTDIGHGGSETCKAELVSADGSLPTGGVVGAPFEGCDGGKMTYSGAGADVELKFRVTRFDGEAAVCYNPVKTFKNTRCSYENVNTDLLGFLKSSDLYVRSSDVPATMSGRACFIQALQLNNAYTYASPQSCSDVVSFGVSGSLVVGSSYRFHLQVEDDLNPDITHCSSPLKTMMDSRCTEPDVLDIRTGYDDGNRIDLELQSIDLPGSGKSCNFAFLTADGTAVVSSNTITSCSEASFSNVINGDSFFGKEFTFKYFRSDGVTESCSEYVTVTPTKCSAGGANPVETTVTGYHDMTGRFFMALMNAPSLDDSGTCQ